MNFDNLSKKENALLEHYFSVRKGGNAPVYTLDISDCELAIPLQCAENDAKEKLKELCEALAHNNSKCNNFYEFYKESSSFSLGMNCVGCFLLLLVACRCAQDAGENAIKIFAQQLRDFCDYSGTEPPYRLNDLWEMLQDKLIKMPFETRQLIFPDHIENRKHVGRTQDLAFPTWRDENKLKKLLTGVSDIVIAEQIIYSRTQIDNDKTNYSKAFLETYRIYRQWIENNDSRRYDTIFGRFLRKVLTGLSQDKKPIQNTNQEEPQDDALHFRDVLLVIFDYGLSHTIEIHERSYSVPDGLREADRQFSRTRLRCFKQCMEKGLFVFSDQGFGTYAMTRSLDLTNSVVILYNSEKTKKIFENHKSILTCEAKIANSPWCLTKLISVDDWQVIKNAIKEYLSLSSSTPSYFTLKGGIRRYSTILNHPCLLPSIHALEDGYFIQGAQKSSFQNKGDDFKLRLDANDDCIDIQYIGILDDQQIKSNKATFQTPRYAPLVKQKNAWSSEHWIERPEIIEEDMGTALLYPSPFAHEDFGKQDERISALEEAFYLKGQHGLNSQDVMSLLEALFPEPYSLKWNILRSLMEAGWLKPLWARGFGAMQYVLEPPHLVCAGDTIFLWGIRPHNVRARFRDYVERLGGTAKILSGISPLAPTITCARGCSFAKLTELCTEDWWGAHKEGLVIPAQGERMYTGKRFESTFQKYGEYEEEFYFQWDKKIFDSKQASTNGISLKQCISEDKRKHRIYAVLQGEEVVFETHVRNVAIIKAFQFAHFPLFRAEGSILWRQGGEGFLPLPFAQALAMHAYCCGGAIEQTGKAYSDVQYAYAGTSLLEVFAKQLGFSLFEGLEITSHSIPTRRNMAIVKHRGQHFYGGL